MKQKKITVAIVEDDPDIREGLAALIAGTPGFSCVGSFADGEEALAPLLRLVPDVVMMDIEMPRMNGIQCIQKLKESAPGLQIMMLTVYEDEEKIFTSLKAGANGYLLKNTPPAKLLEAARELAIGGSPMSGGIARKVVSAFQQFGPASDEMDNLSKREQEILAHLAKGFRYKEIADSLFISVETVRTHVHKIYEKLHVRSRTEAVVKFLGR